MSLLKPEIAAARLDLHRVTLAKWRVAGKGPPFRKLGSAVRYDEQDLADWLARQRRISTSDPGPVRGGPS